MNRRAQTIIFNSNSSSITINVNVLVSFNIRIFTKQLSVLPNTGTVNGYTASTGPYSKTRKVMQNSRRESTTVTTPTQETLPKTNLPT